MRITVSATLAGTNGEAAMECSVCGPLALNIDGDSAAQAKKHLLWHGQTINKEQP